MLDLDGNLNCCFSHAKAHKYDEEVITQTYPCNVYPLIPHFDTAKLGYAGVYLFLFLLKT